MTGPAAGRGTHVGKHVPALVGDLEAGKIAEVLAIDAAATEDVHDVVDEAGSVAFSGDRDVADAGELLPGVGGNVVAPSIVVVILPSVPPKT